jgi:hypothetical protein
MRPLLLTLAAYADLPPPRVDDIHRLVLAALADRP